MLRQLRSNTGRWLFGIAAILIIPSFVVWQASSGQPNVDRSPETPLATIRFESGSKETLTNRELQSGMNLVKTRVSQAFGLKGESANPQVLDSIASTRESFLGSLDIAILRNFSELNGLRVGSEQIVQEFAKMVPDTNQRIQQIQQLNRQNISFEAFVEERRVQTSLDLARSLMVQGIRVTFNEAWIHHVAQAEKLTVDSVLLGQADYRGEVPVPTTASLESYLAAHPDRFRLPNQGSYSYIVVSKDDLRTRASVTDAETSAAYEAQKSQFVTPKAVRASMILVSGPVDQDDQSTAAVESRRLATEVLERARKGEDFASLYSQYSRPYPIPSREMDEDSPTTGGALGLVNEAVAKAEFGDEWTTTVFTATPGSVVGPIPSSIGGSYIVKVDGFREEGFRPYSQVVPALRAQLAASKAESEFKRLGVLLDEKLAEVTTLDQLAAATGTTVTRSGKVNRDSKFLPQIGMLGELEVPIHDLAKGSGLELLTDARRHVVITLTEEYPARVPALQEVRAAVANAWSEEEALKLAKSKASQVATAFQAKKDLGTIAADFNTTVTRPETFTRNDADQILGITIDRFDEVSAGIKVGGILVQPYRNIPSGPITGYAVLRVVDAQEPSRQEFQTKLPEITQELRNRKQLAFLNDRLAAQRKSISSAVEIISESLKND